MEKKIKVASLVGVFLMLLFMNLNAILGDKGNPSMGKLSIISLLQTAIADGEGGTACVKTNYFSEHMKLSTETTDCYKDGVKCGIQQCCESCSTCGECQETECDV
jgi:hypothetical protein